MPHEEQNLLTPVFFRAFVFWVRVVLSLVFYVLYTDVCLLVGLNILYYLYLFLYP